GRSKGSTPRRSAPVAGTRATTAHSMRWCWRPRWTTSARPRPARCTRASRLRRGAAASAADLREAAGAAEAAEAGDDGSGRSASAPPPHRVLGETVEERADQRRRDEHENERDLAIGEHEADLHRADVVDD